MFTDLIPKNLYPVLFDYAKIFIPSFITYLVTRYTLSRPRKYEIREKQFNLVYLPLYRLTMQMIAKKNYNEDLPIYIKKVNKLINKNYQFVFPKTLKLFDRLKENIEKGNSNMYHFSIFEYQINSDYEKLKRELGYPTSSLIDFFKRLNFMDKILYTIFFCFICLGIYSLLDSIYLFLNGDIANSIFSLFFGCFSFFIVYILSYIRH